MSAQAPGKVADGQDWAQAAREFSAAALAAPHQPQAHGNLGVALRRLGHAAAAAASYRRALALTPEDAALWSNLGNALRELGRLDEAEAALRQAVALAPQSLMFAYNLALVLRDNRRHHEAESLLEKLARHHPANAEYAWDLALSRLYGRDYRRGFDGYEARWRLNRMPPRQLPTPRWLKGQSVAGKTLLLLSEQGFGDAIQFARFVPMAAALGARVVLECLPELMDLFATLPGVAQVVAKAQEPPPHDVWAPMLSLPHLLDVTWDTLPAPASYLIAPPAPPLPRPPGTRLRVGLVWAGKTTPRDRSWPLESLLPLLEDPGAAFYSLQVGPRREDLARTGSAHLLHDAAPHLTSFARTAAVMAQLDLVITIDSAPAHLAAALGRPVWVLLRHVSDWRWLDEPQDCAWYPTMRLFRQPNPDDFRTPVTEMAAALRAFMPEA